MLTETNYLANQLPEDTDVIINHRIAVESSVQAVQKHYIELLQPLSQSWNFSLNAFGHNISHISTEYSITLNSNYPLEPSPVTDTETETFTKLANTIHQVFGKDVVASPFLEIGNTDTKFYWDLSKQIYRFNPWRSGRDPDGSKMHTVNERVSLYSFLATFFTKFLRH